MTLNTTIKRGLLAVLTVSMIAFLFLQQDKIRTQAEKILQLEGNITFLESSLEDAHEEVEALHADKETLLNQVAILEDSIIVYEEKMDHLESSVKKSKNLIANVKKELDNKDEEVNMLKDAITNWQRKGAAFQDTIQVLKLELVGKAENVRQLSAMLNKAENELQKKEDSRMEYELQKMRLMRVKQVVEDTRVRYDDVQCLQSRTGKPLKKLKEDGSEWIYTTFSFSMENTDQSLIVDEYFRLKIVDADTGEDLPYNESNAAYANGNETIGFNFQWESNPEQAIYINTQAKKGRNYDVLIYYVSGDDEHLLHNSVRPLIRNGRMQ